MGRAALSKSGSLVSFGGEAEFLGRAAIRVIDATGRTIESAEFKTEARTENVIIELLRLYYFSTLMSPKSHTVSTNSRKDMLLPYSIFAHIKASSRQDKANGCQTEIGTASVSTREIGLLPKKVRILARGLTFPSVHIGASSLGHHELVTVLARNLQSQNG